MLQIHCSSQKASDYTFAPSFLEKEREGDSTTQVSQAQHKLLLDKSLGT